MKLLLNLIALILITACGDDGSNCPGDIELPISIKNYKTSYLVGDTIIITSKFYKYIYDKKTDKNYDATNYKFYPIIYLYDLNQLDDTSFYSKVHEFCTFIEQEKFDMKLDVIQDGKNGAISGEYILSNDSLEFEAKLIFNQSGFFIIRIGSLSSGDGHLQNNYQFKCRGRTINFSLTSPSNNIQLLQNFRSNKINDWILTDSINNFYKHAGYCFEVR